MRKSSLSFLFIVFVLLQFGCNSSIEVKNLKEITSFPLEYSLVGDPTGPKNFFLRTRKVKFVDSLLVVVDTKKSPYSVFLINPYAKDTLYSIAHNGLGPSEFITAWDVAPDSHNPRAFWVIDPNPRSFSFYEIDSILKGELKPTRRFNVKSRDFLPDDFEILENAVITAGSETRSMLKFFSLKDGVLLKESDKIPITVDYKGRYDDYFLASAYNGRLGLHPKRDRIVVATTDGDYLSIVDSTGKRLVTLRTHEKLEPQFYERNDGQFGFTDENKYGYLDIACTNQYIYGLYSGREHDGDVEYTGKTLFVFTWEGEPVAKLTLDRYCIGICVDSDDKTLFALEVFAKQPIIRYDLPDFDSVLNTDN